MKKRYSSRRKNKSKGSSLRTIILSFMGMAVLVVIAIFLTIPLFSNINSFWNIFPSGENNTAPSRDEIPPSPPRIKVLPKATNKEILTVEGYAEPGTTVILFLNSEKGDETVVDKEGSFSFNIPLKIKENRIRSQTKDRAGNKSNLSSLQTVIFDSEKPEIELESPSDGEKFEGEDNRWIEIKGTVEPDIQLTVNGFWARPDEEGKFTYSLRLEEDQNKINIVARDKAGNERETEITVYYQDSDED